MNSSFSIRAFRELFSSDLFPSTQPLIEIEDRDSISESLREYLSHLNHDPFLTDANVFIYPTRNQTLKTIQRAVAALFIGLFIAPAGMLTNGFIALQDRHDFRLNPHWRACIVDCRITARTAVGMLGIAFAINAMVSPSNLITMIRLISGLFLAAHGEYVLVAFKPYDMIKHLAATEEEIIPLAKTILLKTAFGIIGPNGKLLSYNTEEDGEHVEGTNITESTTQGFLFHQYWAQNQPFLQLFKEIYEAHEECQHEWQRCQPNFVPDHRQLNSFCNCYCINSKTAKIFKARSEDIERRSTILKRFLTVCFYVKTGKTFIENFGKPTSYKSYLPIWQQVHQRAEEKRIEKEKEVERLRAEKEARAKEERERKIRVAAASSSTGQSSSNQPFFQKNWVRSLRDLFFGEMTESSSIITPTKKFEDLTTRTEGFKEGFTDYRDRLLQDKSPREVFELPEIFSKEDVEKAYKKALLIVHPDRGTQLDTHLAEVTAVFKLITMEKNTLMDEFE